MVSKKLSFGLLLLLVFSAAVTSARFIDGNSMLIKRLMLDMSRKNQESGENKVECEITRHGDCYYSTSIKAVDLDDDPDARRYRDG
uniref:Uncharacterized protein n=1 Tax=Plectus sambesii TaxID=2011161 RepID=A0A914WMB3_9BILA